MIPKAPFLLAAAMLIALVALGLNPDQEGTASDAEFVALQWVGAGVAEEPRRDGDDWEVDVVRDDGSMVQVKLGPQLELRGFDEEFGPGGTLAHDELRGAARARAGGVALAEVGPGRVVGVEREPNHGIDVGIRTRDSRQVEVKLDQMFRVIRVAEEDPRDE